MAGPALTPGGGVRRPAPPPTRPALTTGEYLATRSLEKERELREKQHVPNPLVLLEVMAEDVVRQGREIAELKAQQAERTRLAKRSFDWMRIIALLVAAAPLAALFWGEWLKLHPAVGSTAGGALITAILGTLAAAKLDRMAAAKRAEQVVVDAPLMNERTGGQ